MLFPYEYYKFIYDVCYRYTTFIIVTPPPTSYDPGRKSVVSEFSRTGSCKQVLLKPGRRHFIFHIFNRVVYNGSFQTGSYKKQKK